jgi:hypothetical protein
MATQDPTTNFGWNLPDVNADAGNWGALLNAILGDDSTGIDARLFTANAAAVAALPLAGGVMTGEIENITDIYAPGALSASGTVTVDLSTANFFTITPSGTVTFAFSNEPASGKVGFFHIEITNGAAQTINWPAEVDWPGGTAPTLTAGVDLIVGYTRDGGTTIRLAIAMENSS